MAKDDKPVEEPEKEVEEIKEESPADDTPQDDAPAEPEEPKEETPEEPEVPEEAPVAEEKPSRREQLRVKDLLRKYPDLAKAPEAKVPDFRDKVEADEDTQKILEETARDYGQTQYNQGLEQAKSIQFHTRLEIDAPRIEAKYPQLDKNSEQFDADAADDINSMYLELVGYDAQTDTVKNPNIRYGDFVDAQMGLVNRLATERVAKSSKNLAKQVAATGLRPDGSSAKGLDLSKAPKDMTDEELKEAARQEAKLYKK